MANKWKRFFIGAATTIASTFGFEVKAAEVSKTDTSDPAGSNRVENVQHSAKPDSLEVVPLPSEKSRQDTAARIDTLKSLIVADQNYSAYHPKFDAAREDMFYMILHFEDVKVRPYKLAGENFYTYGIGNTLNEHGQPVKPNERIRDEEHLMEVVNVHINKQIYPKMAELFDFDALQPQEIVALGAIAYNTGAGFLSELKPFIDEYIKDRSNPDAKKKLANKIKTRCKNKQGKVLSPLVARRDFDVKVFFGDIILCTGKECTQPNELDLKKSVVGGWSYAYYYDVSGRRVKGIDFKAPAQVCDSIQSCPVGQIPAVRISNALNSQPKSKPAKTPVKKKPAPAKKPVRSGARGR